MLIAIVSIIAEDRLEKEVDRLVVFGAWKLISIDELSGLEFWKSISFRA